MLLVKLVAKWSIRRAKKHGYEAGHAFLEGRINVPHFITDSMENILDDMAPRKPHVFLGCVDGRLAICWEDKREAFAENWARGWVANYRKGFRDAIKEGVPLAYPTGE